MAQHAVRRLLLAFVCLAVCAVAAGCESGPGADEPAGSLRLLAKEAEDGDWKAVQTYMDPEAVGVAFGESLVLRLREDDVPDDASPDSSSHGGEFSSGPMVGGFMTAFVENLEAGVESGAVVTDGKLFAAILADGVGETEFVGEDEALVTVAMPGDGGETPIRLRMLRSGDHWQLVAVEDVADLYELFFVAASADQE